MIRDCIFHKPWYWYKQFRPGFIISGEYSREGVEITVGSTIPISFGDEGNKAAWRRIPCPCPYGDIVCRMLSSQSVCIYHQT